MKTTVAGFTLIEILIVIAIISILSTITLQINRSRISEMQALNEREQRLDQHKHLNREFTNSNYSSGQKIEEFKISYEDGSTSTTGDSQFKFQYHTISGSLTITKKPLSLGCNIVGTASGITLISKKPEKSFCFQLNTSLCSRSKCQ